MKEHTPIRQKTRKWMLFYVIGILFFVYSFHTLSKKERLECPVQPPHVNPIEQNRQQLQKYLKHDLVLLESAPKEERLGSDTELPGWRQPSNILYLLGNYNIARSFVLVNNTCPFLCISVFLPNVSEREIMFNGARVDKDQVKKDYRLFSVHDIEELPLIVQNQSVYTTFNETLERLPKEIQKNLQPHNVTVSFNHDVEQAFIQSRFLKTRAELEVLRYASQAARFTHKTIEKYIKKSRIVTESQTQKYFEYVSSLCGSNLQSYNAIVGAGRHGAVLHFPTGETLDSGMKDINLKDFILIDAAGAYNGYASDITRTYARKPTKKLKLLSSIVKKSQKAGIEAHKLGNKWSDVVNATLVELTRGLWNHGFLVADDLDSLIQSGVISIFMPHGVGHPVGLDVHDPVPEKYSQNLVSLKGLRNEYPLKLKTDYDIQKGNVHTVEPGVYFIPYLLEKAKNATWGVSELINWEMIEDWKDVGGVRIEDVVAVDLDGNSLVLSKL